MVLMGEDFKLGLVMTTEFFTTNTSHLILSSLSYNSKLNVAAIIPSVIESVCCVEG